MAAKKTARSNKKQPREDSQPASDIDAEVKAAEEELRLAREALEEAEEHYQETRRRAEEEAEGDETDTSFGDLLDRTLAIVKKHPGLGVAAAAAAGFVLGRLFRRW